MSRPFFVLIWMFCGLVCLHAGCTKDKKAPEETLTSVSHLSPKEVMANVNGTPIKVADLERAMEQRFKSMRIKRSDISETEHRLMELATFESLVGRITLLQEATRRGFSPSPKALAAAKNEVLKTLPEGMTPEIFMSDMGISMHQFETEIADDMAIGMLQEHLAQEGPDSFERLIERLEGGAKVDIFHAPGGGKWNKVGSQAKGAKSHAGPKEGSQTGEDKAHWRDQSKKIRRQKAEEAGLKPWDEGYPE